MTRMERYDRVCQICKEECAKHDIVATIKKRVENEVDGCLAREGYSTSPYSATSGPMPVGGMKYDPKRTQMVMVMPLGAFNFPND